jgi:hypothetical protein
MGAEAAGRAQRRHNVRNELTERRGALEKVRADMHEQPPVTALNGHSKSQNLTP